jgi:hypothetical protein
MMPKKIQNLKRLRSRKGAKHTPSSSRLAELAEVQEILLPELAARIAALEHLLIEKGLCSYDDLKQAREFIKIQETS